MLLTIVQWGFPEWMMIFFLAILIAIVVLVAFYLMRKVAEREAMLNPPVTEDEILNSKVPKEKGYVTVAFGRDTIQLSHEEWIVFNSWDRGRKRIFVKEFKKLKPKQLKDQ